MQNNIIEIGELPDGIVYNGQRHIHFALRMGNVDDNLAALQEVGLNPAATAAQEDVPADFAVSAAAVTYNMRINAAMYARQLKYLGTIPRELITTDFLRANLSPRDLDVLWSADEAIKKKHSELPTSSPPSGASLP